MYVATQQAFTDIPSRNERFTGAVPYCFILDDAYRVIMAGPSSGEDPLTSLYDASSGVDVLPGPIDRVVRALTAAWRNPRTANPATAAVSDLQITVSPLHGYEGRRIAVFVQRAGV